MNRRNITRRGLGVATRHARGWTLAAQLIVLGSEARCATRSAPTSMPRLRWDRRTVSAGHRLGLVTGWGWSSGSTPIPTSGRATCREIEPAYFGTVALRHEQLRQVVASTQRGVNRFRSGCTAFMKRLSSTGARENVPWENVPHTWGMNSRPGTGCGGCAESVSPAISRQ